MGTRGPNAKSPALTLLQGNRGGKSFANLSQIDGVRPEISIPDCPAHLNDNARAEWDRVSPHLEKHGIISDLDMAALAVYCSAYSRWVEAEVNIQKSGLTAPTPKGYLQMSVWLQISNRAVEQMDKAKNEFGMSPASRSRVTPTKSLQSDLFGVPEENGAGRFFKR